MFQVRNLTVTHKTDLTALISGLSFVLSPGDRAALIGEEGNGKSTLLKLLQEPSLPYVEWTGELPSPKLRRGYLAQELGEEELASPIVSFCLQSASLDGADLARAAARVGLSRELFYEDRPLSTLSGGERVKLRLALLLLEEPDVLLLDEPSNDLDLSTLRWLEEFLLSCTVPVLYVSHDEALLEKTANMIIHLERLHRRTQPRATVCRTGYREYVERRELSLARQEKNARKEREELEAKEARYRQLRDKVNHAQKTVTRQDPHQGKMLKRKMHAVQSAGKRLQREKDELTPLPAWEEAIFTVFDRERAAVPAGKEILRLDLPALTAGEKLLSRDVRLWVTGPERIGIIGKNGAGKSTLLKAAAEALLPRKDIRAAYMPQSYGEGLPVGATPVDLLAPSGSREDVTLARTLLGTMKYKSEEMEHPAAGLSGGQRAKLLFLEMVLRGANVLLLDEPTRNFSPLSAPVIRQILAEFPGCIISVSHDRMYLEQVCTRILELTGEGLVQVG